MTKKMMTVVAAVGLVAAGSVAVKLKSPQEVRAGRLCTPADAAGSYGIQLVGSIANPDPAGTGTVPFVEGGRLVADGNGNFSGASVMSVGGFNTSHTFTGTVDVKPDCTARAHVNSSQGWPNLDVFWVILKPNEEIMLTGQVPGAATSGRAIRQVNP